MNMKIKKGDNVLIIFGKDRGKKAKVLEVMPKEKRVVVEGVNVRKRHVRPRKTGEKGQIVQLPGPIDISNIKFICSKCGKATRLAKKIIEKKKFRICKKCGQAV